MTWTDFPLREMKWKPVTCLVTPVMWPSNLSIHRHRLCTSFAVYVYIVNFRESNKVITFLNKILPCLAVSNNAIARKYQYPWIDLMIARNTLWKPDKILPRVYAEFFTRNPTTNSTRCFIVKAQTATYALFVTCHLLPLTSCQPPPAPVNNRHLLQL